MCSEIKSAGTSILLSPKTACLVMNEPFIVMGELFIMQRKWFGIPKKLFDAPREPGDMLREICIPSAATGYDPPLRGGASCKQNDTLREPCDASRKRREITYGMDASLRRPAETRRPASV